MGESNPTPIHFAQERRTRQHSRFSTRVLPLPHTVHPLCYDGVAHEHGAQALGKEDTGSLSGSNGEIFGAKE
jgi:hypothetical protein